MSANLRDACKVQADLGPGNTGYIYSLTALEKRTGARVSRLPVSIRIVLESLIRNCDGKMVLEDNVLDLARWQPNAPRTAEIPYVVGRVVLNCVAGIPLLGDLTAMRGAGMPRRVRNRIAAVSLIPVLSCDRLSSTNDFSPRNCWPLL